MIFRPSTVELSTDACQNPPSSSPTLWGHFSNPPSTKKASHHESPSSTLLQSNFTYFIRETSFTSWKLTIWKRNLVAFVSKQSSLARAWEIITIKNNLHVDSARGVFGCLTNRHKAPLSAPRRSSQTVAPKLRLAEIASASLVIPHARE